MAEIHPVIQEKNSILTHFLKPSLLDMGPAFWFPPGRSLRAAYLKCIPGAVARIKPYGGEPEILLANLHHIYGTLFMWQLTNGDLQSQYTKGVPVRLFGGSIQTDDPIFIPICYNPPPGIAGLPDIDANAKYPFFIETIQVGICYQPTSIKPAVEGLRVLGQKLVNVFHQD